MKKGRLDAKSGKYMGDHYGEDERVAYDRGYTRAGGVIPTKDTASNGATSTPAPEEKPLTQHEQEVKTQQKLEDETRGKPSVDSGGTEDFGIGLGDVKVDFATALKGGSNEKDNLKKALRK